MRHLASVAVLAIALPLAACSGESPGKTGSGGAGTGGGGTATGGGDAGVDGPAGTFTLTSAGFAAGAEIPPKYACSGANVSPPLAWTGAPAGTKAYAVVLTDLSINLVHWVIWDIPSSVAALPEHVENAAAPATPAGAKQTKSYDGATFGYLGPCPPTKHDYEFAVHAVDVATLPGVTSADTGAAAAAAVTAHALGSAKLVGSFAP